MTTTDSGLMNVLDQYIDLYESNRSLVNEGSNKILNLKREEALSILKDIDLQKKGTENYEITDLKEILGYDYGVNLNRLDLRVDESAPFHCGVPNLSSHLVFLKNDIYSAKETELPAGVYVGSLKDFCRTYPELALKHYGHLADIRNPLVALNSLLVQDGVVVWVKEGVKHDKPVQIVGILENDFPLMALRRILVIAEKDSEIKILVCDHTRTGNVNFLNLQVAEIYAEANASVEVCEMEESTETTSRLAAAYVNQDKSSRVSAVGITLFNGVTRNEYHCSFKGEDASLQLSGMAIEDRKRKVDTFSVVNHTLPGCHTDELFKYVVDDDAAAAFSGLIRVFKGASKTEAYQSNRNLIGNDGARVFSKPRLEIYEDDVKCSHGSAIGQLDPMQIFYMRSRGLSEDEARFLLKQAFMADVIDRVSIPGFKMRLHNLVERRFAGDFKNCASCSNSKREK